MDIGHKEGYATFAVLARDKLGLVKGLWFEKKQFSSILEAKAKVLFNACSIAKDQYYVKIIIESDCKILVDAVLGYAYCLWYVYTLVEDIKIFLEDFPSC